MIQMTPQVPQKRTEFLPGVMYVSVWVHTICIETLPFCPSFQALGGAKDLASRGWKIASVLSHLREICNFRGQGGLRDLLVFLLQAIAG